MSRREVRLKVDEAVFVARLNELLSQAQNLHVHGVGPQPRRTAHSGSSSLLSGDEQAGGYNRGTQVASGRSLPWKSVYASCGTT